MLWHFLQDKMTVVPVAGSGVDATELGRKVNLSDTDVIKIKKMYKCSPYDKWWALANKLCQVLLYTLYGQLPSKSRTHGSCILNQFIFLQFINKGYRKAQTKLHKPSFSRFHLAHS